MLRDNFPIPGEPVVEDQCYTKADCEMMARAWYIGKTKLLVCAKTPR